MVELNPAEIERARATFLRRIPDFGDFTERDGTYWREERAYKDELSALARSTLTPELFGDESDAGADRVTAAARHVLLAKLPSTNRPQNLASWRYTDFLRRMTPDEHRVFAGALAGLLFGPGPSPERAAAFTGAMWPVFRRYATGNPFAQGRMLPTLFLMLFDPEHNIAVRTDLFDQAARRLLGQSVLRNAPFSAAEYRDVLAFTAAVRRSLEAWAWCPHDLIDVHSFLWVVTSSTYGTGGPVSDAGGATR